MSSLLFAPLLLALLSPQGQPGGNAELAQFQGKWKTASLVVNGEDVPAERYQDEVVSISGNERRLKKGEKLTDRATVVLHPGTNPKGIDFTFTEGPYKGTTLRGIYKLEGDTLTVNLDLGDNRPSDFTCVKNSGRMLQKLKRIVEK